jgi:cytochrome c-type biogenesis protein CcsB
LLDTAFYKEGQTKDYSTLVMENQEDLNSIKENRLTLLESVDNISYRTISFGFPLLTIGIIAGAVWANEAWGSYWSWDPKETWALITWLVFASYLHARITKSWQGRKPALIASFGFVVVWICYLGVNFLGKGLHTYGQML